MALLCKDSMNLTIDVDLTPRGLHMTDDTLLSPREQEVLVLLWKGFTPREISRMLHRSINTIAMHRKHILKKLGVKTSAAAIQIAVERRLVSPPPLVSPDKDKLSS